METFKFFFQGPFNQDETFQDLDKIIQNYKNKENRENQIQLIDEFNQIIQKKNYLLASDIMRKYGNRKLNDLKEIEKFINFLFDRFIDKPSDVRAEDFISVEDEPATMFIDRRMATNAVKENLIHNAEEIALWLANNATVFKVFEFRHKNPVGYGFLKDKDVFPCEVEESGIAYDLLGSRIVLEKDSTQELGFKLLTAFPIDCD